ncbi:polyphosphate--glucose phosphotransferase [Galbitalea soli]|uniref:ROK family protein n=1 Tax=Galbitalea soli TaxID=1268042 RepID=A0A7C9TNL9_9MICO|nr:ROK family protein [Galbitalea soli]NEM90296.1 ROK family protein [Galbitalea soli]NYJ31004.1 polyphosphate glucokinase [Galbitalea soli]
MTKAVGIDIGGTGIKGAVIDTATGALLTDRIKLDTPKGGEPDDIVKVVVSIIETLAVDAEVPVGVCFPAVIIKGHTMSAANVSKKWIGLDAEKLFEKALGRDIRFINDADAAGVAEVRYGAAKDVPGVVILTTLGTGIGSALIYNGVLVPNTELGHLEVDGKDAESRASYSAKERDDLSFKEWAKRLQRYYDTVEALFSPDLIIVGGGISKSYEEFLPLLELRAPIVPAALRNNAGILGAAALAAEHRGATGHAAVAD